MDRGRVVAVAALMLVLAGCLAPVGDERSTGPSASPPTDGRPDSVPGCRNYVTVVKTGPLPTDFSEDGPLVREQARLEADIMAIQAYTQDHPDEFGLIRIENSPWVRIVVGFTGHLAEHCTALRELAEYPDEFELVWSARSDAELNRLRDEIIALSRDGILSAGVSNGRIELTLWANREELAEELRGRYGDLVSLTVGLFSYPDRIAPEGLACSSFLGPLAAETPFRVTPFVGTSEVRSGGGFSGTVAVVNMSDAPVDFESGRPATAIVVHPDSIDPIGVHTGMIAGTGIGKTLAPGESIDIDVVGGTASCDPSLGYALPPGEYEIRVPVDQYAYPDPNSGVVVTYLLSEPAPLTIVP